MTNATEVAFQLLQLPKTIEANAGLGKVGWETAIFYLCQHTQRKNCVLNKSYDTT